MRTKTKKKLSITARFYDLYPGNRAWEQVGVEAMDITVYLPENKKYDAMEPRVVSCREGRGKTIAIQFTGVQLNLNDKNLRWVCRRLILAHKNLVLYIRKLA